MDRQLFETVNFPFAVHEDFVQVVGLPTVEQTRQGYERLIGLLRVAVKTHLGDQKILEFVDTIAKQVDRHCRTAASINNPEAVTIPSLTPEVIEEYSSNAYLNANHNGRTGQRLAIAMFCALYSEVADLGLSGIDFDETRFPGSLKSEHISYLGWKASVATEERIQSTLQKAIDALRAADSKSTNEVLELVKRGNESVIEMQKHDLRIREQARQLIAEVKVDVQQIAEDATSAKARLTAVLKQGAEHTSQLDISRESIERHAKALRHELGIGTTKKLWRWRGNFSAIAFWASTIAITAAFVAPIYYLYSDLEGVISTLTRIGDAATKDLPKDGSATGTQLMVVGVARLAVITIPLAIYFWAVKLLVRYNARSMMLMDDARQRQTMMDVFTHFLEKNETTSEERALVMNALFRPVPGHGPENVDPPNFAELLGKATKTQ